MDVYSENTDALPTARLQHPYLSNADIVLLFSFLPGRRAIVPVYACPRRQLWDIRNTASALRKYTGHTQDTTACVFLDPKEEGGVIGGRGGGGRGGGTKAEQGAENVDGALCDPSSPFSCASRRMIATASKDGSVKIYDLENGKHVCVWLVCCIARRINAHGWCCVRWAR